MRLRAGKWLIGAALLATLAFPLLVGGTSALDGLTRLPILDYLGMATVIIASWCARTLKLQALLRHLGTDVGALRMLRVSLAADVGFLITPGGVGGYATSVYYLRRVRASLSDAVAVTSADQALDAIYFAVAIPLAAMRVTAAAAPHPTSLLVAFACALALLAIAAWAWRRFRQPGMRRPATVPTLPRA